MVCFGGTSPISWTDKPKGDSLLHDFMGRAGMWSTVQKHQEMQNKTKWNSVANWKNDKPMGPPRTAFAESTSTRGQNKRQFTGQVYARKQPKHSWSQAATHQNNKLSWCGENVAGAQDFANAESSKGGWNRKNSGFGRGGHRGGGRGMAFANAESSSSGGWNRKNSGFGRGGRRGGGRGMWKSEGSHRGGSNSTNWRAQNNNSARQCGISYSFTPVEQQIYTQVEPIIKNVKRIIRESRYISWPNAA